MILGIALVSAILGLIYLVQNTDVVKIMFAIAVAIAILYWLGELVIVLWDEFIPSRWYFELDLRRFFTKRRKKKW